MFIKISHYRLKKRQNIAEMLCGTPKTRRFSVFLSHFSKIIFEKGLFRQSQRSALLALGRAAERRPMRKKLRRRKCLKNAQTPQRQVHALLGALFERQPT
jgi:hypothetical protein